MPANIIGIREQGVDLSDQYVSPAEVNDLYAAGYLNSLGESFYNINYGQMFQWGWPSGSNVPTIINNSVTWLQIDAGRFHSTSVKTDGTLWTWGNNNLGQLGLGNTTVYSSPQQVGTLTNWKLVNAGNYHSLAIKTDGTLWGWGRNELGELGLGDTTNRSSPVQVGSLTNWKQISNGSNHAIAIKTDGTLWSWGLNNNGQLGQNNTTFLSSPVQVGSLTNWKEISSGDTHSLAIKTDGTLWSWGYNNFYGLGLLNDLPRSSPVQVGTLTNWKQVYSGKSNHSLATKTDGTLWAWGRNSYGELGLNSVNYGLSSPVQVGALTNWKLIGAGAYHTLAIKTDGTLWVWGQNGQISYALGALGLGDTTNRSSPVQVGSLTNWKQVSGGLSHSLGIK